MELKINYIKNWKSVSSNILKSSSGLSCLLLFPTWFRIVELTLFNFLVIITLMNGIFNKDKCNVSITKSAKRNFFFSKTIAAKLMKHTRNNRQSINNWLMLDHSYTMKDIIKSIFLTIIKVDEIQYKIQK